VPREKAEGKRGEMNPARQSLAKSARAAPTGRLRPPPAIRRGGREDHTAPRHEHRHFPETDGGEIRALIAGQPIEGVADAPAQSAIVFNPPDPGVRVQERTRHQVMASMSRSSTAGANGSSYFRSVPRTRSHGRSPSPAGTSRATVRPRLVMVMDSPSA
jgi:hypothetical protein